jgi:hypothetical protein
MVTKDGRLGLKLAPNLDPISALNLLLGAARTITSQMQTVEKPPSIVIPKLTLPNMH